jgi:hypothetical protein
MPLDKRGFFRYKIIKLIGVIMFLKDLDSGRIQIQAIVRLLVVVVVLMGSAARYL